MFEVTSCAVESKKVVVCALQEERNPLGLTSVLTEHSEQ